MSSLLQVFTRQGAFFLFAGLEVVCFYLIITYNEPQQTIAESSWSLYSGRFKERANAAQDYFDLEAKNEDLRNENAELLSRMPNAFYIEQIDSVLVESDSLRQRYTYIGAQVINKSPLSGNITYVLDRGYIHGVEPHQGVVNSDGVVGIVTKVSQRHCRVMALTHRDVQLSVGLRNKPFFGSLNWRGGDVREAVLSAIPEYADVKIGDTVETTGYSNIFPTGVAIGLVKEKEAQPGDNTLDLKVTLFNDFFGVDNAYIVRDLLKSDLDQLDTEE